jgi:hypothetical protein
MVTPSAVNTRAVTEDVGIAFDLFGFQISNLILVFLILFYPNKVSVGLEEGWHRGLPHLSLLIYSAAGGVSVSGSVCNIDPALAPDIL